MHKVFLLALFLLTDVFPQPVGVGTRIDLTQTLQLGAGQFAQLFIPDYFTPPADGKFTLVFHLHSASWAAENEVYRASVNAAVFNIHLGSLSSPYQNYFADQGKFQRILDTVLSKLKTQGIIPAPSIGHIIMTSFSAGYAGVREMLKNQSYYDKISALLLADGLHSSSDPGTMHTQMRDFVRYAKNARDGSKIFLLTHSSITTSGYQSTTQTANYLLDSIGTPRIPFSAADEIGTQYSKADTGNFHLKGYYGTTADDHLKHLYAMYLMVGKAALLLNVPLGTAGETAGIPAEFRLFRNYPNPFNPVTRIKFALPEEEFVTIKVYNSSGEEVMKLLNEVRPAGTYDILFNGAGLPSGVYLCRIFCGEYTDTIKMVLLK